MKRILLLMTLAVVALVCPRPAHGQGAVEAWVQRYNGPGNGDDYAAALAVDTNGNLFVTGSSYGSGSDYDYATIKYSGAGVPLWTNRYNGPANGEDSASAVAVDTNGNVFVTGSSEGSGSSSDFATIKYSNAGVPLWTNRYNGPGNGVDGAGAMALDTNGNVFVTGSSYMFSNPKRDDTDYATIKYSNAGVPLWTNRYDGPNAIDEPADLAVDTNGNVFVTGQSLGIGGNYDYATIKYSGTGVPLWTNRYSGFASAVAVDGSGNVFVTGHSAGSDSSSDFATIKYSNAGVPLWTNRYNGPANDIDEPIAMALDTNGLTTVNWSNVLTTPIDNGATKTVMVNPPSGNRFYRLSSP